MMIQQLCPLAAALALAASSAVAEDTACRTGYAKLPGYDLNSTILERDGTVVHLRTLAAHAVQSEVTTEGIRNAPDDAKIDEGRIELTEINGAFGTLKYHLPDLAFQAIEALSGIDKATATFLEDQAVTVTMTIDNGRQKFDLGAPHYTSFAFAEKDFDFLSKVAVVEFTGVTPAGTEVFHEKFRTLMLGSVKSQLDMISDKHFAKAQSAGYCIHDIFGRLDIPG